MADSRPGQGPRLSIACVAAGWSDGDSLRLMLSPDDVLERTQWDTFWIPADARVVERPELQYLRCARDVAMLNTVVRTRGEPATLSGHVDEVIAAHQGVCSRWLVRALPLRPALEEALSAAGYVPTFPTRAYTIAVEAYRAPPTASCEVRKVGAMAQLEDSLRVMEASFGSAANETPEELQSYLAACTQDRPRVYRYLAYDARSGEPLSTGGMTHYPELRFCLLWAGSTIPEARGRGCYGAVLAARVAQARALGAARVGLYAALDTSAPIVRRVGFEEHEAMTFWDRR